MDRSIDKSVDKDTDKNTTIKQFVWNFSFWIMFLAALYLAYFVYFPNTTTTKSKWVGLFAGSVAILFAAVKFIKNVYLNSSNPNLTKITKTYLDGVKAIFFQNGRIILFLSLFFYIITFKIIGSEFANALLVGVFSGLFLNITNQKSIISTSLCEVFDFQNEVSFKKMFNTGISSSYLAYGVIIALSVIFYHIFKDYQYTAGFAFGAGLCYFGFSSMNAICLKSTIVAKDVLNSSEYRNGEEKHTLIFANEIFESIKSTSFLSGDLISSFACVLIAAISVGMYCMELMASFLPIIIAANGIFAAIFVLALVRLTKTTDYIKLFVVANIFSIIIFNTVNYFTINYWMPSCINLVYSLIIGTVAGLLFNICSIKKIFYCDKTSINISNSAIIGTRQVFAQCLKETFLSSIFPFVLLCICVLASFSLSYGFEAPLMGLWGVILAGLGFLVSGIITLLFINFSQNLVNLDLFSDLFKNELDFSLIKETGVKFLSVFKRYTNFSLILTFVSMILAYSVVCELEEIDLVNPYVVSSLLLGCCVPFIYLAMNIGYVFKNSKNIVFNIKHDLKFYLNNKENLEILNINTIKRLCCGVSYDFAFCFGVILFLFFLIAIGMKTEAVAGFLIGCVVASLGLVFVVDSMCDFLDLAKKFFKREYKTEINTLEINNLSIVKEVLSFGKDFVCPILTSLIKFLLILAFALIPLLITF